MFRIFTRAEPGLLVAEADTIDHCFLQLSNQTEDRLEEAIHEGFIIYNCSLPWHKSTVGWFKPIRQRHEMG